MTDQKDVLRVGAAVRRRRRGLGLTLTTVAARSGLSVPFLSQIENERARPSTRSLQRVAEALETTAVRLLSAADAARVVDLVQAGEDPDTDPEAVAGVRSLVRGQHQMQALEFTGEHDAGREFLHRNDELMYVVDGAAEVEAEGRVYLLGRGDTLYLSGGVRHRWRATLASTRILLVAVADHIDATASATTARQSSDDAPCR
ncbi:helix-turn-helix domain-containing protein [Streptomyces beijiangensis]|uniref:Helix-turn-helix domain-containing protein n=1 Tax=Streptomyces beijiangensis TaxID=163361 RepID=A0A939FE85_9ACTN|nr:helix-turn-helix domain-containing protein [Streptomyces beijiangensis]MBO0516489.1 helix-turn-helix domain-containing protein [Streptomyces beijiangensis]